MKNLLLISSILFSHSFSFSQNLIFNELPDIPVDYVSLLTTSRYNNKIIINGGKANIADNPEFSYDYLLIYDTETDIWSTLTTSEPLSSGPVSEGYFNERSYENGEIIGNNLYTFNGWDLNNELKIIDIESGNVSLGANNPVARKAAGSAVWENNIYTFGGCIDPNNEDEISSYTNSLYLYNVSLNSWTELASMPEAKESRGEIINNKLYVVGGYNGSVSNKIDVYNISTNQWENQYVMPFSVSANSLSVVENYIFIIGDYVQLNRIAFFDVENGTFTNIENNMLERRHSDAEIINENLFLIGGNSTTNVSDGGWLNSIEMADLNQTLNVGNFQHLNRIKIYPNPTTNYIKIKDSQEPVLKYEIYDTLGKLIKLESEFDGELIDMRSLIEGAYFVTLYFEKFSKTFKVLKN